MKKSTKVYRTVLRILGSLALLGYILLFATEPNVEVKLRTLEDYSVLLLILVFLAGYYYLWKNELISGILWIVWYALTWFCVFWVWGNGGLAAILGTPIFILGVLLLIYGLRINRQN
jgi:hypothetical protein